MLDLVRRHPVAWYFVLAYAISWTLWAPLFAGALGWTEERSTWWHYAGAYGPALSAILVSLAQGGGALERLARRFDPRRVPATTWAIAIGSPLLLFAVASVAARAIEGAWPAYEEVAKTGDLPALGLPLTFLVHLVTFGVGEETGWRGFALPALERERSVLGATRALWVGWGLWHLPTFATNDVFTGFAPIEIVGWGFGLYAGALFFTWLFHAAHEGLLAVVLWHALFNTLVASEAGEGTIAAVMTAAFMVAVFGYVALRRERFVLVRPTSS